MSRPRPARGGGRTASPPGTAISWPGPAPRWRPHCVIVLPALSLGGQPQSTVPWTDALGRGRQPLAAQPAGRGCGPASASIAFVPLLMFAGARCRGLGRGRSGRGRRRGERPAGVTPAVGPAAPAGPRAGHVGRWVCRVCGLWAPWPPLSSPRPQVLGLGLPLVVVPAWPRAAASRLVSGSGARRPALAPTRRRPRLRAPGPAPGRAGARRHGRGRDGPRRAARGAAVPPGRPPAAASWRRVSSAASC